MTQDELDVVVVGGGLAGLAAATRLHSMGARLKLLEASGRIGGRTRSELVGAEPADFGAEWTGTGHRRLMELVNAFGLHLEPAGLLAQPGLWRGSERTRQGRVPRLRARDELAFARMMWRARRLARQLDPERPWRTAGAERLDAIAVGSWLKQLGVGGDAYRFFGTFVGALISAPIERMSLLHFLWWLRRGGGAIPVLRTTFGYRIREGAEALSHALAEALGDRVAVDSPVRRVEQGRSSVEVSVEDGRRLQAAHAIVAVPCRALPRIDFDPVLPSGQRELNGISNEPGTKVHALLPPGHRVRARFALGDSRLAAAWRHGRRLTGFATPPADVLPQEQLVGELAGAFGAETGELMETAIYRWRDHPYVPGCDIAFAPGDLSRLGDALREPHGRVHFAGAERGSWPNNMEGAIESGYRSATAIQTAS